MRLSRFINVEREQILREWETFARTLGAVSEGMDIAGLRDHADEMLTTIAADIETPQTEEEQRTKSFGARSLSADEGADTAAEEHGADRAERGFTIDQMVSEYRALRASVIRLWLATEGSLSVQDFADMTRFNEAIDQALAESVARYTEDLEQSKEIFLAILGHDLRTPLGAIIASATYMLDLDQLQEPHITLTARIASSGRRMHRMVGDLLDLTRSRLGGGIPIERTRVNMEEVVRDVVSELGTIHAGRAVDVAVSGNPEGCWDRERMMQVLTNLLSNALEHGAPGTPVGVRVEGGDDEMVVTIHNQGDPIPPTLVRRLFDPMKRRQNTARTSGASSGLGLGLYIAERVVTAHGGTIEVSSTKSAGTSFVVRLPREERPAPLNADQSAPGA